MSSIVRTEMKLCTNKNRKVLIDYLCVIHKFTLDEERKIVAYLQGKEDLDLILVSGDFITKVKAKIHD